jgi:hypothetical protein
MLTIHQALGILLYEYARRTLCRYTAIKQRYKGVAGTDTDGVY